jgi:1,2-diacylglycerol 3-beta-galactosyltransferase
LAGKRPPRALIRPYLKGIGTKEASLAASKKVLILTADAGFGHRAAANAVAQALRERQGDACTVEIVNPLEDQRAPAFLRKAQDDYDRVIRAWPELYRVGYQASDGPLPVGIAEQALIVMLYSTLRDTLRTHRPDAIVTTYPLYQAPLAAIFALDRDYIPVLTVVTDLVTVHALWFNEDVDRCLVPTADVLAKALESGLAPDRVEITGLPVNPALAQPVDRVTLREQLGWRQDRRVALFAGSKRVTRLEPVAEAFNHSGLPLELALIAGGDEALRQRWADVEWHLPAHVYGYVDNVASLMLGADFIVCKAGGLIVSEALAAGLPLLLVEAIPGQETGNADYVVRGEAGVLADNALDALITAFHWLDGGGTELARRGIQARRLGNPHAAARVAKLAWEAARRGPQRRERRLVAGSPLLRNLRNSFGLGLDTADQT